MAVSVGPLGEKKILKVKEQLGADFVAVSPHDQPGIIIVNPSKQIVLILTSQQITFGADGDNVVPDFDYIRQTLTGVFDVLLLDPICTSSGVQIVGNYSFDGSSMNDSFRLLNADRKELETGIMGIKGVGFRFLIDHNPDTWEYKIEPLIANPSFYFVEAICGNSKALPLNEVINIANNVYANFVGDWGRITEKYLLERG